MDPFSLYFISQGVTLYYLYKLEDANCNCVMDWRHNFVKYFTIATLLLVLVVFVTQKVYVYNLLKFMYVLSLVSLYAFYTYVDNLEKTQCSCAVKGMYWTHKYLYYWRYLLIVLTIGAGIILMNVNKLTINNPFVIPQKNYFGRRIGEIYLGRR